MRIIKYSYEDIGENGFKLGEIKFRTMNLLIGFSGSGKTRLLNTIFNLGRVAVNQESVKVGSWKIEFQIRKKQYSWELWIEKDEGGKTIVMVDILKDLSDDKLIVKRTLDSFEYFGKQLPKLKKSETSVSLLRDEKEIEPIHQAFSRILKRDFAHDSSSQDYLEYEPLSAYSIDIMKKGNANFESLMHSQVRLNVLMYALKKYDSKYFKLFSDYFKEVFPNVEEIDIKDIRFFNPNAPNLETPVICLKEKDVDQWIQFKRLSSGMQKVIIMMADVVMLRDNEWLFLVDEYENSLGPKIIDFYYNWIQYIDSPNQFLMTSHHPHVINNIPIEDWYICTRKGSSVDFIYGDDLTEIIGKSNQSSFTKLLNSSLYNREHE
jgi:predicted ATP-dependent endonuclease of OLD family